MDELKNNEIIPQESDFLLYTTPEGDVRVDVLFSGETVWLTQKRMTKLFGVDVRTISEHIQNIFKTAELLEDSVIRKFRNTATDGKVYETQFYNLDMIISVGYRVNSEKATKFRNSQPSEGNLCKVTFVYIVSNQLKYVGSIKVTRGNG